MDTSFTLRPATDDDDDDDDDEYDDDDDDEDDDDDDDEIVYSPVKPPTHDVGPSAATSAHSVPNNVHCWDRVRDGRVSYSPPILPS